MSRGVIAVALLLPTAVAAQVPDTARPRNYSGLSAGASVASVWVAFDDEDASGRWAGRLDFGYRIRQLCVWRLPIVCWQRYAALAPLRLTPHISILATDIRGMDVDRDKYAYAFVDIALRASYGIAVPRELRPYVELLSGTRSAERRAPLVRQVWNYTGSGKSLGVGLEIPIAPSGRGLDVGVTWIRGRFTQYEFLKADSAANMDHRAIAVHVGWSGPFTGISLPWH